MQVFLSIETKRFEIEFFKNSQLGICEKTDFTNYIRILFNSDIVCIQRLKNSFKEFKFFSFQ